MHLTESSAFSDSNLLSGWLSYVRADYRDSLSNESHFLKALDDQLQSVGAKFDICDTVTLDDLEEMSLVDVLTNAITD